VEVDQGEIPFRADNSFFRSREIREDPYRWRCRGDRPRQQTRPRQGGNERNIWILGLGRIRLAAIPDNSAASIEAFCADQREDRNDAAHRRPQIVSRAHRLPTRPAEPSVRWAGHIVLPWIHRVFALMKRWGLGTYHGLRRKHIDHVSQRVCLPIQSALLPARLVRDHARACLAPSPDELLGYRRPRQSSQKAWPTVRRQPRRRKTATGMQADRSTPPEKSRTQPRFGFDPLALDIDQPGTTG